jgi:hypothetical protein
MAIDGIFGSQIPDMTYFKNVKFQNEKIMMNRDEILIKIQSMQEQQQLMNINPFVTSTPAGRQQM